LKEISENNKNVNLHGRSFGRKWNPGPSNLKQTWQALYCGPIRQHRFKVECPGSEPGTDDKKPVSTSKHPLLDASKLQ